MKCAFFVRRDKKTGEITKSKPIFDWRVNKTESLIRRVKTLPKEMAIDTVYQKWLAEGKIIEEEDGMREFVNPGENTHAEYEKEIDECLKDINEQYEWSLEYDDKDKEELIRLRWGEYLDGTEE